MSKFKKPEIKTAIPKRRYQYGEFQITVLGDIESESAIEYRFIIAVMTESDPEPGFYLTAETNSGQNAGDGKYQLRLIMRDGEQIITYDDQLANLDYFVEIGMKTISTLLNLKDEEPYLLT